MQETQKGSINVGAATLPAISYTATALTGTNIFPGWSESGTATIKVAAGGAGKFEYECSLEVTTNTKFTDLYFSAESSDATIESGFSGEGKQISSADGEEGVQTLKIASGTIETTGTEATHTITYKLTFKDTDEPQTSQEGGSIVGAVTCKLSGEAKYTDSQQKGQ